MQTTPKVSMNPWGMAAQGFRPESMYAVRENQPGNTRIHHARRALVVAAEPDKIATRTHQSSTRRPIVGRRPRPGRAGSRDSKLLAERREHPDDHQSQEGDRGTGQSLGFFGNDRRRPETAGQGINDKHAQEKSQRRGDERDQERSPLRGGTPETKISPFPVSEPRETSRARPGSALRSAECERHCDQEQ